MTLRGSTLQDHLAAQPVRGTQSLEVAATKKRTARTAQLELRFAALSLPTPQVTNAWIRKHAPEQPLAAWVVELVEVAPPVGEKPLRWVLLTPERVESVEEAQQIVSEYTQRWAIEEYHKCLKDRVPRGGTLQ